MISTSAAPPSCLANAQVAALVEPHQRRVQHEAFVHAEIERHLQCLDGVVAAVGIAREVGFAHAADQIASRRQAIAAAKVKNKRLRPGTKLLGKPSFSIAKAVSRVSEVSLIWPSTPISTK
jgi:hypothetical protein